MGTRARVSLAFAFSAASLFGLSCASAEDIIYGSWSGGPFFNQDGRFAFCGVSAPYNRGDVLILAVNNIGEFIIGVRNDKWQMQVGEKSEVDLKVDNFRVVRGTGEAINASTAIVKFANAYELFMRVRRGRTLYISAENVRLMYDLSGTSGALAAVAACVESQIRNEMRKAGTSSSSQMLRGTPQSSLNQSKTEGSKRIERTELVILSSNILSQAGISGYRLLADADKPAEVADFDVAWVGPGSALGAMSGVQLDDPFSFRRAMDSTVQSILSGDSAACGGNFASKIIKKEGGTDFQNVVLETTCLADSAIVGVSYSLHGYSDGRVYTFAMATVEQGIDPSTGSIASAPSDTTGAVAVRVGATADQILKSSRR